MIAHGGQNNEAAAKVAARFPDVKFVVTQGAVTSPNLASYDVLQQESAYLADVFVRCRRAAAWPATCRAFACGRV
ncbi:MAG: hypothetical protein ABI212_02450 [Burkholderiaceae bacterium]